MIIDIELVPHKTVVDVEIEIGSSTIVPQPEYEGPYEVIPTIKGFVLGTKDKSMVDDLSVLAIPYQEVSNPQGGETVIIAFS